jgi:hypothetical protein
MTPNRRLILALCGAIVITAAAHLTLRAQERPPQTKPGSRTAPGPYRAPQTAAVNAAPAAPANGVSLQDALLQRIDLPFAEPTSLQQVAETLERMLHASVVVDQAALERKEVTLDDPVQLKLKGARLKTTLKLLFGQVGLTYLVIPEDNLLLVTDSEESDERYLHILDELRSLHRDLHSVQDALDELLEGGGAAGMAEPGPHKIGARAKARVKVERSRHRE